MRFNRGRKYGSRAPYEHEIFGLYGVEGKIFQALLTAVKQARVGTIVERRMPTSLQIMVPRIYILARCIRYFLSNMWIIIILGVSGVNAANKFLTYEYKCQ